MRLKRVAPGLTETRLAPRGYSLWRVRGGRRLFDDDDLATAPCEELAREYGEIVR